MERLIKDSKIENDFNDDDLNDDEKDNAQRVSPSRKYSVLEDSTNKTFIEDHQKIETF